MIILVTPMFHKIILKIFEKNIEDKKKLKSVHEFVIII